MTNSTSRWGLVPCVALAAVAFAAPASAATADDTFDVTIDIQATCSVTAGSAADIDLGSVLSTATDISGSGTIVVNCSKTTPYYLGLAPSNNATDGQGLLAPENTSGASVPYELRSTAGASGTIWGNTATSTAQGNGVAGIGNGADQEHTVYVTVANANYAPDTYSDQVTVTVNY